MARHWNRRDMLRATTQGMGVGLVGWAGLSRITPAQASYMRLSPDAVVFRPEIEPVVRWIEETPRDRVFDRAVDELRDGLSYQELMAGLFLAGIRNIQPRPVGFKFHAVMVINSAHVLSQTAAVEDRLLPMFWSLDNFKGSQQADVQEGDWTLQKVDEAHLPSPGQARNALIEAFEAWDVDKADTATAALCRSAGAAETMEVFWRCAVRDQRNIGHKPIFAMQCWRTLQAIGWQHAEPVLRSLAYGLLDLQGDSNRAPVGPYESNKERASKFREDWQIGKHDVEATRSLLDVIRRAGPEDASEEVLKRINDGISPDALWDAVLLAGHEIMLREPGIVPLHSVTAANSLHYIFNASGDDETRRLALLQAAGWVPMYRQRMQLKPEGWIDAIEPISPEAKNPEEILSEISEDLDQNRQRAAAKAVSYLENGGSADALFSFARQSIFLKGRDSHDYKFGAAAWEEYLLSSDPRWNAPLAVAILSKVPGSGASNSPLMERAREAVARAKA